MMSEFLEAIKPAPRKFDSGEREETFEQYQSRISHLLPNFPEELLKQWLYDLGDDSDYFDLVSPNMYFELVSWSPDRIYHEIQPSKDGSLDGLNWLIFEPDEDYSDENRWLGEFMKTNYTWPEPIIVLFNDINDEWGEPYHLLEGNRRLTILESFTEEIGIRLRKNMSFGS